MAELRRDPLTGGWSLVSSERRRRPAHLGDEPRPTPCALCPGQGSPLELARGERGVRVVAHGRPALRVERSWRAPRGDSAPAVGAHEVLIEGDSHTWAGWAPRRALLHEHLVLLEARCQDLAQDARLVSMIWVRDQDTGLAPPGTHPHGQFFALPVPLAGPPVPRPAPDRTLCSAGDARAVVVPAPQRDFQLAVCPGESMSDTAQVLWRTLVAVEQALASPPVSCAWTRPAQGRQGVILVQPWLERPGGLDLVPLGFATWSPSQAAATLRAALPRVA